MKDEKLKILLVEDDEDDYLITRDLLGEIKDMRFALDWVTTYNEAVEVMSQNNHDVCVIDYYLGEFNGVDLLREAKKRGSRKPMILLTGARDKMVDIEAMKAGASDYLVKGQISPYLLERSLRYSVAQKQSEEEIKKLNEGLEKRVIQRTQELEQANKVLEKEINERKRAETKLKKSLEEKEVLLKEIHHRVKNNLQIISSLLNLQSRNISDETYLNIFKESQNRVKLMSLVHEKLYQSNDLANIDFSNFIRNLASFLFRSYGGNINRIKLNVVVDENVMLGIDTAIPCGLIINELISNCLKYAFPEPNTGEILLSMHSDGNDLILIVKDNGVGLPKNLDIKKSKSLGLQLVSSLCEQLGGNIKLVRENGTEFTIRFPATLN